MRSTQWLASCAVYLILCTLPLFPSAQEVADTVVVYEEEDTTSIETYTDEEDFEWELPTPRIWDEDSMQAIRQDKAYGYMAWMDSLVRSRTIEPLPKEEPNNWWILGFWLRIAGILVIVSLVILLIVKLGFGKKGLFRSSKAFEDNDHAETTETEELYDNNALQLAISNRDYKRATRMLYLQTLQHLEQNGYIRQLPHKTNYQYLLELADPALKREVSVLMMYFEYVWFGHFEPDDQQFDTILKSYQTFLKR